MQVLACNSIGLRDPGTSRSEQLPRRIHRQDDRFGGGIGLHFIEDGAASLRHHVLQPVRFPAVGQADEDLIIQKDRFHGGAVGAATLRPV